MPEHRQKKKAESAEAVGLQSIDILRESGRQEEAPAKIAQRKYLFVQKIETKELKDYVNNGSMRDIFTIIEEVVLKLGVPSNQSKQTAASCILILSAAGSPKIDREVLEKAHTFVVSSIRQEGQIETLLHRAVSTERLLQNYEIQREEFSTASPSDDDLVNKAGRLITTYDRLKSGNTAAAEIIYGQAVVEARRIKTAFRRQPKP